MSDPPSQVFTTDIDTKPEIIIQFEGLLLTKKRIVCADPAFECFRSIGSIISLSIHSHVRVFNVGG